MAEGLRKRAGGGARFAARRCRPIAVLCADLHFSHAAPIARSPEPDWYAAMARAWHPISAYALEHNIPVLIAGDIFDRWHSPPELISFVIGLFRGLEIYAVPGQHDMPAHSLIELHRSAYGVLAMSGVIHDLSATNSHVEVCDHGFSVLGVPYGGEIRESFKQTGHEFVHVLLAHKYVWTKGSSYPGAPEEAKAQRLLPRIKGYDVSVFGDNHASFLLKEYGHVMLNCGSLMPRRIDQRLYKPRFGVLFSDRHIELKPIPTDEDVWDERAEEAEDLDSWGGCSRNFLVGLKDLRSESLDFNEVVLRCLDARGVEDGVRAATIEILDSCTGS